MKSIRKSLFLVLIAFISLSLFIGCTSKPSTSEIEEAVKSELQNNIPVSWVGNLLGGKNAKISTLEIKEWGSFNKKGEYWPIKIRVVGSAELNDPFNQGKVKRFDKVAEFKFRKDDYRKWQASLSGGMFQ